MPDQSRAEELIRIIFEVLNQQKVSPEEGFVIAEEILLSSVERLAKINNLSPEQVNNHLLKQAGLQEAPTKKTPYIVGSGRGWIGNPNATTENN
jgi:hypothetical protein